MGEEKHMRKLTGLFSIAFGIREKEEKMKNMMKKFAVAAALAGMWCGCAAAADVLINTDTTEQTVTVGAGDTLAVRNSATLTVNGSTTTSGLVTLGGSTQTGTLDAKGSLGILAGDFTVRNTGILSVEGRTTIGGTARLLLDSAATTVLQDSVAISGTLQGTTVGTASTVVVGKNGVARVTVQGGTIDNIVLDEGMSTNAILRFSGKGNKVQNTLTATNFATNVDGDVEFASGAAFFGGSYTQNSGAVTGVDNTVYFSIAGKALITGPGSSFALGGDFAEGLTVANGARLIGTGQILTGAATLDKDLVVRNGAQIDLSHDNLTADNFQNVSVGSLLAGVSADYSHINYLNANNSAGVAFNLRNLELTSDLSANIHNTNIGYGDYAVYGNVNNGVESNRTLSNIFGDYTFTADGSGVWLSDIQRTDLDNVEEVRSQLGKTWDEKLISNGLAAGMAAMANDASNNGNGIAKNTTAGQLNRAILTSLMNSNSVWDYNNGKLSGTADHSALAMYNGQTQAGVNYVAEDTTREILGTLHSRLDAFRKVKQPVEGIIPEIDSAVEAAYGSLAVPECSYGDRYLNRIWAGGLGTWQNADRRNGFDGYKYNGKGVILGADRANGAAMFGAAISYIKGDYEDKTATRHDSEIKHYSANVYATYNASSGFFYSLMGGYTYSDNDIRETRGGRTATEDYHTNTWSVGGKTGFDFEPTANLVITPSVGVNFIHSQSSEHNLNYAGTADIVRYGDMKHHVVEIPFDIQIAREIDLGKNRSLQLSANGGYAYNLNDKGVAGNVTAIDAGFGSYSAIGRRQGHHSWKAGAGARLKMDQWDIGVKYDYLGRSGYDAHRVMGTVGFSF